MAGRGLPTIRRSGSDSGDGSVSLASDAARASAARRDRRATDVHVSPRSPTIGATRSLGDLDAGTSVHVLFVSVQRPGNPPAQAHAVVTALAWRTIRTDGDFMGHLITLGVR
jgi:hypothetical protein